MVEFKIIGSFLLNLEKIKIHVILITKIGFLVQLNFYFEGLITLRRTFRKILLERFLLDMNDVLKRTE